jgi:hypothetical protein
MGVCLAENSLMMVMENFAKSKQVLGGGRWTVDFWMLGAKTGRRLVGSSRGRSVQVRILAVQ